MGRLDALNEQKQKSEDRRDRRESAFKLRVAVQQFLKHHGPLLRAWGLAGHSAHDAAVPGEFEARARESRALAVAIAAKALGKDPSEITMQDARHFRTEAAEIVARHMIEGSALDVARIAGDVGDALASADPDYDAEVIEWRRVTGAGSAALTTARAAALLWDLVAIYDFRLGRAPALARLSEALQGAVKRAVDRILPEDVSEEDVRVVSQSLMREFASSVLEPAYETWTRRALDALRPLDEPARRRWLAVHTPFERMLSQFAADAEAFTELARATSLHAAAAQEPKPSNNPGPA